MEGLTPHLVVGSVLLVIALVVAYIKLGWWLTTRTSDKYGYNIWNWLNSLLLLYMVATWIFHVITSGDAPEQQLVVMWISSAVAFMILWIHNWVKTSFLGGFLISVYQSSVCAVVIGITLLVLCGFSRDRLGED